MNHINVKKLVVWLLKFCVAGMIALTVISVFVFVYSYSSAHIRNESGSTDYKYEPNQIITNMKEGFSFLKMDKNGFNNLSTKDNKETNILLMGSSHMEAVQVDQNENIGSLLYDYLPEKNTYNIGMSGHTVYRLADNIANAIEEYNPTDYVIIEISSVEMDIDDMKEILDGNGKKISVHDEGVLSYLQKIPAFTALYDQADRWIRKTGDVSSDFRQKKQKTDNTETVLSDGYSETLNKFLSVFSNACKDDLKCVFLYIPPEGLDNTGLICSTDQVYLNAFEKSCEENDLMFINCTPALDELHEKGIPAHGFCNGGVAVGHINKYGHEAVAKLLAEKLK